jgi:DNA-binding NarL/FixJ family response regulator
MRVMIVEDNSKMREVIKRTILDHVKDVETIIECENGEQAIKRYIQSHADWVLMDIQLEKLDGLVASKAIMDLHAGAKIIIVTSYGDSRYREAARSIGVYGYVLKENLGELAGLMTAR